MISSYTNNSKLILSTLILIVFLLPGCGLIDSENESNNNITAVTDKDNTNTVVIEGGELPVTGTEVTKIIPENGGAIYFYILCKADVSYWINLSADIPTPKMNIFSDENFENSVEFTQEDLYKLEFTALETKEYYLLIESEIPAKINIKAEVATAAPAQLIINGLPVKYPVPSIGNITYKTIFNFPGNAGTNYSITAIQEEGLTDSTLYIYSDPELSELLHDSSTNINSNNMVFTAPNDQDYFILMTTTNGSPEPKSYTIQILDKLPVSSDILTPSIVPINTKSNFFIFNNSTGFISFPTISNKAYGVYLTNIVSDISVSAGYCIDCITIKDLYISSDNIGNSANEELGFAAEETSDNYYLAEVKNYTNYLTGSFDIMVKEVELSGNSDSGSADSAIEVPIGTPTWIGARVGQTSYSDDWLQFNTDIGDTSAAISFTNLTVGLEIKLYSSDGVTLVSEKTSTCSKIATACTFSLEDLSSSANYKVRMRSYGTVVGEASVGIVTITTQ